jgi:acyl-coenzyme A thioesterase PaaI-like protein
MTGDDARVPLHPSLRDRGAEVIAVAQRVRRLVQLAVVNDAPPDVLAEVAATLDGAIGCLERHVPNPIPPINGFAGEGEATYDTVAERMVFDHVIGPANPMSLPVELRFEPPRAVGVATFTSPFEGPPGNVHGGVIASTFDMVLSVANMVAGVPGPTAELTIRYRRPTRLGVESVFTAEVASVGERRVLTRGVLEQDGVVCVEAEAASPASTAPACRSRTGRSPPTRPTPPGRREGPRAACGGRPRVA